MKNAVLLSLTILACGNVSPAWADPPVAEITIDCSRIDGAIRPLHGVNSGPIHLGETLDLSARFREIGVPLARLHDCHWPNADVIDIHVVFPDFNADPSRPESYDFRRTDDYIQAIVKAGSGIVFRLGESIEHSKRKRYVHPPADPAKWAAICVGILRHYNEGWANGFRHNIRYWEVWNEPENRPAMWSGTDEDYFRLYSAAAKALKSQAPGVLVGGPAAGYFGRMEGDALEPSPFVRAFLEHCRRAAAPLDFFSWHTYTNDPYDLARRARAVRRLLDAHGFQKAENHLNEWNYLPDGDWSPMLSQDGLVRQRWFDRMGGAEGAAFTAAALMLLQDSPLDVGNFYSADVQGFGMFNEYGVPKKSFYAIKAFRTLLETPDRIILRQKTPDGIVVAAGVARDRKRMTILASNVSPNDATLRLRIAELPWSGKTRSSIHVLDAQHELDAAQPQDLAAGNCLVEQPLKRASVCLVVLAESEPK